MHCLDGDLEKWRNILMKMFKVRPYFVKKLSIDEMMMMRYYVRHCAKMYMRGKTDRIRLQIWCLCSSSGYCGKSVTMEEPLGARVITNLITVTPNDQCDKHDLFFHNFFTSYGILCHLRDLQMKTTGTIRENRVQ